MSQTKAQRRKQKKRKARSRAILKQTNIARNLSDPKWQLDLFCDGKWNTEFHRYRKWDQVQKHLDETEALRKEGVEIIAGRIVDMRTRETLETIEAAPARVVGVGALPDTLAGKPGADKAILK